MPPRTTSCGVGPPAACGLGLGRLVWSLYFCDKNLKQKEKEQGNVIYIIYNKDKTKGSKAKRICMHIKRFMPASAWLQRLHVSEKERDIISFVGAVG